MLIEVELQAKKFFKLGEECWVLHPVTLLPKKAEYVEKSKNLDGSSLIHDFKDKYMVFDHDLFKTEKGALEWGIAVGHCIRQNALNLLGETFRGIERNEKRLQEIISDESNEQ